MAAQADDTTEVICPSCGNRFSLTDKVIDHLHDGWSRREGQRLRKELSEKAEKDAEPRVRKQFEVMIRERDEQLKLKDRKLKGLERRLEDARKKAGQQDQQALGDLRQESLCDVLTSRFTQDDIQSVARGKAGADVIQLVREGGRACGKIIWESKRTSSWNRAWIGKLKDDQRRECADVAVIVSDALPEPEAPFAILDDVFVTSFEVAPYLGGMLRIHLIEFARLRGAKARRDDLKGAVYDYLTGSEFAEHFRGVVAALVEMQGTLDKEKRAMTSIWKSREREIDAMTEHLAEVHGDLRSIGAPLPPNKAMELPAANVRELAASK